MKDIGIRSCQIELMEILLITIRFTSLFALKSLVFVKRFAPNRQIPFLKVLQAKGIPLKVEVVHTHQLGKISNPCNLTLKFPFFNEKIS
jgi:hypothetical protein